MQDLFTRFVTMGPSRSLGDLARQTGIAISALVDISTKDRWHERCQEIDKKAAKLFEDDAAMTVAAVTKTQLAIAAELQEKALLALRTLNFTRAEHVIQALKLSIEVQRKALSMDDQGVSAEEKVADLLQQRLSQTTVKKIEVRPFEFDPKLIAPPDPNDTEVPPPAPEPLRETTVVAERIEPPELEDDWGPEGEEP